MSAAPGQRTAGRQQRALPAAPGTLPLRRGRRRPAATGHPARSAAGAGRPGATHRAERRRGTAGDRRRRRAAGDLRQRRATDRARLAPAPGSLDGRRRGRAPADPGSALVRRAGAVAPRPRAGHRQPRALPGAARRPGRVRLARRSPAPPGRRDRGGLGTGPGRCRTDPATAPCRPAAPGTCEPAGATHYTLAHGLCPPGVAPGEAAAATERRCAPALQRTGHAGRSARSPGDPGRPHRSAAGPLRTGRRPPRRIPLLPGRTAGRMADRRHPPAGGRPEPVGCGITETRLP